MYLHLEKWIVSASTELNLRLMSHMVKVGVAGRRMRVVGRAPTPSHAHAHLEYSCRSLFLRLILFLGIFHVVLPADFRMRRPVNQSFTGESLPLPAWRLNELEPSGFGRTHAVAAHSSFGLPLPIEALRIRST